MTRSIRRQITLASLVTTVALLAAMGIAVLVGLRIVLVRQLDRQLAGEARLVASLVGFDAVKGLEVDEDALEGEDDVLVELRSGDAVLYRSEDLPGGVLPAALAAADAPAFAWADVPGEGRVRCLGVAFHPAVDVDEDETALPDETGAPSPLVRLTIARSDDSVAEVLRGVLLVLAACALALGAGAVWLSRRVARSGLRPLRDFAGAIARLDGRSLAARLDTGAAPEEVRPVGDRLNELLDRLEATLERERAMSADVAHELRTPLAGMRASVEVAMRAAGDPAATREALGDALAGVQRLQALTDRLLWLVRLDAGTVDTEIRPVALDALVAEIAESLRDDAAARGLRVELPSGSGLAARSDPVLLGIALRNLMENAVAYADPGGRVRVEIARVPEGVRLLVANSGSAVPAASVPDLLRRFTRGDSARTAIGARCGLGLPLVDRIAQAMGHRLEIATEPGGEFGATLVLQGAV